ncbi:MAG: hypothetical protein WD030_01870 [Pirellulales bacterium]
MSLYTVGLLLGQEVSVMRASISGGKEKYYQLAFTDVSPEDFAATARKAEDIPAEEVKTIAVTSDTMDFGDLTPLTSFVNLAELKIQGPRFSLKAIGEVPHANKIEVLELRSFEIVEDTYDFSELPNLKILGLWGCRVDVTLADNLLDCEKIERLYIYDSKVDPRLVDGIEKNERLKHASFYRCEPIDSDGMETRTNIQFRLDRR